MESATGHEKLFCIDQKTTRNCHLSEAIDVESERQTLLDIELQQQQQVERE